MLQSSQRQEANPELMRKNRLIRWFFNNLYRLRLPPMVQYWKHGDMARAKLVTLDDGSYAMLIEGEKYPLLGFPRGPVLFGPLATLKHLAKNLVFNQVWKMLEEEQTNEEIMAYLLNVALPELNKEVVKMKYDMFPPDKLCPAVKELWRALSAIEGRIADKEAREQFRVLKEGITFFFQEDDAYRFRLQWIARYIDPRNFWRRLYYFISRKRYSFREEVKSVLAFLDNAEITPDMKGRSALIKRVFLCFMGNYDFAALLEGIVKELDWKKLKLSKADTYYFRGKYFKVDYDKFDY